MLNSDPGLIIICPLSALPLIFDSLFTLHSYRFTVYIVLVFASLVLRFGHRVSISLLLPATHRPSLPPRSPARLGSFFLKLLHPQLLCHITSSLTSPTPNPIHPPSTHLLNLSSTNLHPIPPHPPTPTPIIPIPILLDLPLPQGTIN